MSAVPADNTSARRLSNKKNAIQFATLGLAVFVSDGKIPLIQKYNRLDTALTDEEREQAIAEHVAKHDGQEPVHVGSTKDINVLKRMFRRFPDAVPSIACGPSKLVVLDADQKDDGPAQLRALFDAHGGIPEGVAVNPTKSGGEHFVFADPDGKFTNRAGALKKLGVDVRGTGGQFVAPGSIREDGKSYGSNTDKIAFLRAIAGKTLPTLPSYIVDLIGQASEGEATLNDGDPIVKDLIARLGANDWPGFDLTFDAELGKYCLDCIRERAPDFGELFDSPSSDRSTNRFKMARYLIGALPGFTVEEYASFCESWDGAGDDYNHRDLAREFAKAKRNPEHVPVTGDAFGPVDDDEDATNKSSSIMPFEMEVDVAANAVLPDWLVEEVIETETVCFFYGPPNAGKSLALLDLLYHVASGKPWRGREVKRGCVLYISVEGSNGTARRAKAWRAHHGVADGESLPLAFIRFDIDLFGDKKGVKAIIEAVRRLEQLTGLPCRAVAIDTVNAVTPGMDENKPADWRQFVGNLRDILVKTKAAVIPVHHTGKDENKGLRGSNVSLASGDSTILVSGRTITTKKMRDGKSEQKFEFTVDVINLWIDHKGKPVGAPVAVERLGGSAMGAVDSEDEAADDATLTPPDTPEDKLRATLRVFNERAEAIAADTGDPVGEIGLSRGELFRHINIDRRRSGLPEHKEVTVVNRLIDKLIESGAIVKGGGGRATSYRLAG